MSSTAASRGTSDTDNTDHIDNTDSTDSTDSTGSTDSGSRRSVDTERRPSRTRGRWGMLIGLPLLVALIGGGWVWWRSTADLDDIEERTLAWS